MGWYWSCVSGLRAEESCWQILGDILVGLHKRWNWKIQHCVSLRIGVSERIAVWYMFEEFNAGDDDFQLTGEIWKVRFWARMYHWTTIVSDWRSTIIWPTTAYNHRNTDLMDNYYIWNAIDLCRLITFKYLNVRQSHWMNENSNKPINYEMIFSSRWCSCATHTA